MNTNIIFSARILGGNFRSSVIIDLSFLGCLLGVLYFFLLGNHGLIDPDEGRYSEVALNMIRTHDYISPHVNGVLFLEKPIFFYWLQVIAIKLFGLNTWALRFFPALSASCTILFTYGASRALYGRSVGLVSALILATMPVFFGAGHYANLDMEVSNFISCALFCFILRVVKSNQPYTPFLMPLAYVFSALGVLTKGLIGLAFPMMIIGLWMIVFNQWKWLTKMWLIRGLVLFALIVTPWFYLVTKHNPTFLHYYFIDQQVIRFLSHSFNNIQPAWFYCYIIALGAIPWSFFSLQALYYHFKQLIQSKGSRYINGYFMIWLFAVFTFFSIPHSKLVGYILPALPPLAILVSTYLVTGFKHHFAGIKVGLVCYCIFTVCALLGGTLYLSYAIDPNINAYRFYAITILALLCLGSLSGAWFYRQKMYNQIWLSLTLPTCLALLVVALAMPSIPVRTMKPFVIAAQPYLKQVKEIASYDDYFPSLALYFNRRITTVSDSYDRPNAGSVDNWSGMFVRGMKQDKSHAYPWIINTGTFWQRWAAHPMLVVIKKNSLLDFEHHKSKFWTVACYQDMLLLSNFQTKTGSTLTQGQGCRGQNSVLVKK